MPLSSGKGGAARADRITKRLDWRYGQLPGQSTRRESIEAFGGWLSGPTGVVTAPTKPVGDRGDKTVSLRCLTTITEPFELPVPTRARDRDTLSHIAAHSRALGRQG